MSGGSLGFRLCDYRQCFLNHCRLIYMLSTLYVGLTIKVKVGIPGSFKVGWHPTKKLGRQNTKTPKLSLSYSKRVERQYNFLELIRLDHISHVSTSVMLYWVAEGWGAEMIVADVPVKNNANRFSVQKSAFSIPFHGLGEATHTSRLKKKVVSVRSVLSIRKSAKCGHCTHAQ